MPWPCPEGHTDPLHPHVEKLVNLLKELGRYDALDKAVKAAVKEGISELIDWKISNRDDFLHFASCLLKNWVPSENSSSKFIYHVLTLFYYIFDHAELNDLQTLINPKSIGPDRGPIMTRVSSWIVEYSREMGKWLSKPESITAESYKTFKQVEDYRLEKDYHIPNPKDPKGGFSCFNELFRRHLKVPYPFEGVRHIEDRENQNKVIFPADSTFDGAWDIDDNNIVTIKSLPWPIEALLKDSSPEYIARFKHGKWCHAFLNTFDYHRQHAPVAGTIVESHVIPGLNYLQVEKTEDKHGRLRLRPRRSLKAEPDAIDGAGYQFIQTRGCIIIDTGVKHGLVAVLPIGMAQVSSVGLTVKKGDKVRKGDEISWFEFGGSDIVLVFERAAGATRFPPVEPQTHHFMGEHLCQLQLQF